MLLTDEGCCGGGGASQDYAVFGAMEEGLISRVPGQSGLYARGEREPIIVLESW